LTINYATLWFQAQAVPIVTSEGVWGFGPKHGAGTGYTLLLNGQQAANGEIARLLQDNNGMVWIEDGVGNWFIRQPNKTWSAPVKAPPVPSAVTFSKP
jgi:ligand-binding sensor domain-containing protein